MMSRKPYHSASHCKYLIQYHIIWCPKFRFSVLHGKADMLSLIHILHDRKISAIYGKRALPWRCLLYTSHFHGEWASRLPDLDDAVVDEFVHAITRSSTNSFPSSVSVRLITRLSFSSACFTRRFLSSSSCTRCV